MIIEREFRVEAVHYDWEKTKIILQDPCSDLKEENYLVLNHEVAKNIGILVSLDLIQKIIKISFESKGAPIHHFEEVIKMFCLEDNYDPLTCGIAKIREEVYKVKYRLIRTVFISNFHYESDPVLIFGFEITEKEYSDLMKPENTIFQATIDIKECDGK